MNSWRGNPIGPVPLAWPLLGTFTRQCQNPTLPNLNHSPSGETHVVFTMVFLRKSKPRARVHRK